MHSVHQIRQNAAPNYAGCFSSSIGLTDQGYYKYQSSGYCANICYGNDKAVLGLSNGTQCWCGNLLPPARSQVAQSRCDTPCQGYNLEDCGGGTDFFTVWVTGLEQDVANYNPDGVSSSSTSSGTSSSTSSSTGLSTSRASTQSTQGSQTSSTSTSLTAAGTAGNQASSPPQMSDGSHGNRLGIILGVVLGVLALIALLIVFWWIRRRRRRKSPSTTEGSVNSEVKETTGAKRGDQDGERPSSTFRDDAPAELSANSRPVSDNAMRNIIPEFNRMSTDEPSSMPTAPHQTNLPHATTLESTGDSYHNPFTSDTDASLPIAQAMSGTNFMASNFAGDSLGQNLPSADEAGNGYPEVGSVLVATRDFMARSSDEITMVKGDRIVLVERDEKWNDGWFRGRHTTNGKIGLFPEVFTKSR